MLELNKGNVLILAGSSNSLKDNETRLDFYALMHNIIASNMSDYIIVVYDTAENNVGEEYGVLDATNILELKVLLGNLRDNNKRVIVVPMCSTVDRYLNFIEDYYLEYRNVTFIFPVFHIDVLNEASKNSAFSSMYKLTYKTDKLVICYDINTVDSFEYNPLVYRSDWYKRIDKNKKLKELRVIK